MSTRPADGVFTVTDSGFALDGRPVRLLSGALHYFRVHEAQWAHRLEMLRAMGLNCVETYVPWNLHEPFPGQYRDVEALGRFLDAVHAAGLWALVRPGPYICAEWENGGLPQWLTGTLAGQVRTRNRAYLEPVRRWFGHLLPQVVERQVHHGGPVIMVQVENEYGSYGSDQEYLRELAHILREGGVTVPLFTSDGPEDHMLTGGSLPGVLATVNFGSHPAEAFRTLRRHQPAGPLMCMEFWCGWFAHWGAGEPEPREARDAAAVLREILECGASVNIYMAHGGTSFGGWAGANRAGDLHDGALQPTVTSYDYGAPVDERGRPTELFRRFREVLADFADAAPPPVPAAPPVLTAPVTAVLDAWTPLDEVMDTLGGTEGVFGTAPTFEDLDVDRGLVRYRVGVPGPRPPLPLSLPGVRDLVRLSVDGIDTPVGTAVAGPAELELWVESLGRVNYGPRLGETKGLTGGILHERQYLHGVSARGLRLDAFDDVKAVAALPSRLPEHGEPGLYRGSVDVSSPGDAMLELPGWSRGFVWVNGFCLGRYWSRGPQSALFVPGPVLRPGVNEVWVLETDRTDGKPVRLV
ncbi:beta-galactosidase family protein [Streptomyces argenteolus]|uniref:Beta-galactosidase family protein n=1 Tax=Streptomyces argenteolus TaxID=67274 RepID=A0ABW6XEK5_9ACTN